VIAAALLLAAAVAAEPTLPGGPYASLPSPEAAASDLVLQALAPAPDTVTLEASYGAVTFSHSGHLARRTRCIACHGEGVVSKVDFTPKVAHQRCKGCHREERRGPLGCRDCHAVAPQPGSAPATATVAQATTGSTARTRSGGPPGPSTLSSHAGAETARAAFHLTLEAGCAASDGAWGPSVRLSARQGRVLVAQSVDRLVGDDDRLVALFGAGIVQPIHRRVGVFALATGGVDVLRQPIEAISPAVGGRLGLEFLPRTSLGSIHLSVTGLLDVSRRRSEGGDPPRTTLFATVGTGVSARRR
jgi:hypothetical protein